MNPVMSWAGNLSRKGSNLKILHPYSLGSAYIVPTLRICIMSNSEDTESPPIGVDSTTHDQPQDTADAEATNQEGGLPTPQDQFRWWSVCFEPLID